MSKERYVAYDPKRGYTLFIEYDRLHGGRGLWWKHIETSFAQSEQNRGIPIRNESELPTIKLGTQVRENNDWFHAEVCDADNLGQGS